ncbi:TPA: hypothetical protein QDB51_003492 [Burkholderia vietnamiensis]|nr:hypothetical protein [Burkholderia vietnamiensis]
MNQDLHIACIRDESEKTLQTVQTETLPAAYINECLASAVLHGNIEVLSSIVEASKFDPRVFDLTALLEKSVGLKQFEITSYLVGHPSIGELDLNVVLYSRGWQEYEPLQRKVNQIFKLICQTNQQNLWHQASLGRLDVVKHIVESKNYYDLYPSLLVAATCNKVEIVAYLFDKAGSILRHEQIRKLLAQATNESKQWLEKAVLHQNLGENLVEKEAASKLKI